MANTLGERFKKIRKSLKMTQKEFAESLGVTQTTISGIENDSANTSLTLAKLISLKYTINEDWILNGTGQMRYFPPEWSTEDIDGLMQKFEGMKILLNDYFDSLKSDKNKLFYAVESFAYFTSMISSINHTDADCTNYLNIIFQLFDDFEKYTYKCSFIRKNRNINFEDLYYLKEQEIDLHNKMMQVTEKILSVLIHTKNV